MNKNKVHTAYKIDGVKVPSVTTVLGILNKPALVHWAWQLGCDGIDYREARDNAADIGTLAHYLIMCYLKGEEPDTSEYSEQDIDKAENCVLKFHEWARDKTIEPIIVEGSLVSKEHRFGGTIDFYGYVNSELTLVDFKTGKALYLDMFGQLAGYEHLLIENSYPVESVRILRIGRTEDEGFEERTLQDLSKHWKIFWHCLELYNLQKEVKKGAK